MTTTMICCKCGKIFLEGRVCPECKTTDVDFTINGRSALDVLQDHARLAGRTNEIDWRTMHSEFLYSQDSSVK